MSYFWLWVHPSNHTRLYSMIRGENPALRFSLTLLWCLLWRFALTTIANLRGIPPWPRTEAPTLRDRTYEHGAKVISGKPITLGHGYSTLAWIPESQGSWALPLRHDRISSHETPISRAVLQLKQV